MKYSFDQVRFCSKADLSTLRSVAKNNALRELFIGRLYNGKCSKKASFHYKSQFSGRPKNGEFFSNISNRLGNLEATITYIEIACDKVFETENDALLAYLELESSSYLAYQNPEFKIFNSKEISKDFFDGRALYLGKRGHFQLVFYTRYDKDHGLPILRREFRLTGNTQIMTKLEVEDIKDIKSPERLFIQLEKSFYRRAEINHRRVHLLMKYRKNQMRFKRVCEFRRFYCAERYSTTKHSPRYLSKLSKPFSYYLTN